MFLDWAQKRKTMREGRKWTRRALVDPRKGVGCWQCCRRGAFGLCELKGSSSWELHSLEGQQPAISFNFQGQQHGTQGPQEHFLRKCLCLCFRIAGDTALNKNIHESVSAQIRKNFAKSKWRVSPKCVCFVFAKSPRDLKPFWRRWFSSLSMLCFYWPLKIWTGIPRILLNEFC